MSSLNTTWKHIRRSPYQAIAAILILTLTFFVVSIFAFIIVGSSKVIEHFESKPQVTAFFKEEVKQEEINVLKIKLDKTGKVASIRFVSKKEALKIYQDQNKDDPLLLELVTADILPASLEISTHEIEDLSVINDALKDSPLVQEVVFQKDVVATLSSWTSALRKIGIGLIVGLSVVSIFIMATIIGIKISQKRDEIEIVRLLGATNWYIRWPFIFEALLYGAIGAFFGWLIASGLLLYLSPFLASFLKGIPILPVSFIFLFELLGIEFLFAFILTVFSSFLAVLRYLK